MMLEMLYFLIRMLAIQLVHFMEIHKAVHYDQRSFLGLLYFNKKYFIWANTFSI